MIDETCSCGASFKTDEVKAVALVREWRRKHRHEEDEGDVSIIAESTGRSEILMGFQADGLSLPVRQSGQPYWGDDE